MKKENYLMSKTNPEFENLMKRYKPFFEKCKANDLKKLSITVAPDVIETQQTLMLNEIILMAEHNREWIELILFTINFKLQQIKDSKLYYGVEDYLTNEKIAMWMRKLGESIPITLFFLQEWEARLATIAGDIMINKTPEIVTEEGRGMVYTSAVEQTQINNRLRVACSLFMHYCQGTGFDPQQAIEAMLAEFNAAFEYSKVEEVFKKELKEGIKLRVKKV